MDTRRLAALVLIFLIALMAVPVPVLAGEAPRSAPSAGSTASGAPVASRTASGSRTVSAAASESAPATTSVSAAVAPATIDFGQRAWVSAVLRDAGGTPIPNRRVVIEACMRASVWTTVTTAYSTTGRYNVPVTPGSKTYYRVRFPGGPDYAGSTSPSSMVAVRAYLSPLSTSPKVYKGRGISVVGYLKPRHAANVTGTVTIEGWMYVRGVWKHVKDFPGKVTDNYSYSKFAVPVFLPYVGKWRVRAVHADAYHVYKATGWAYVNCLDPNIMVFPVRGTHSYSDDFGDPRSGGRTHQGCDILAPRNTPIVATLAGTVTARDNNLGGHTIWLTSDAGGWEFYYAHMDHWAVTLGHVYAGQVIGYVGNTGNAAGGPTHCHFEMHPNGGAAVNPYPYLRAMER